MRVMIRKLRYIRKYRLLILIVIFGACAGNGFAQGRKLIFGLTTGYEFASAYYEKNDDIPFKEKISLNYSFGLMMQLHSDSSVAGFSTGVYYKFRSFTVDMNVDNLDPNYNEYLTAINPEYYIVGMPAIVNWNVFKAGNFSFGIKSGIGLELTVFLRETSEYNNGEIIDSDRLIPYSHDKKVGIPLIVGAGADWILDKKVKIGLYPVMNLYIKKFNPTTEAGYSSVFGLTLDVFLL